jgi:hypothetical protein
VITESYSLVYGHSGSVEYGRKIVTKNFNINTKNFLFDKDHYDTNDIPRMRLNVGNFMSKSQVPTSEDIYALTVPGVWLRA